METSLIRPYDAANGRMEQYWMLVEGDKYEIPPGISNTATQLIHLVYSVTYANDYPALAVNLAIQARRLLPISIESGFLEAVDRIVDCCGEMISTQDRNLFLAWVDFLNFLADAACLDLGWESCFTPATVAGVHELLEDLNGR